PPVRARGAEPHVAELGAGLVEAALGVDGDEPRTAAHDLELAAEDTLQLRVAVLAREAMAHPLVAAQPIGEPTRQAAPEVGPRAVRSVLRRTRFRVALLRHALLRLRLAHRRALLLRHRLGGRRRSAHERQEQREDDHGEAGADTGRHAPPIADSPAA